MKKKLFICFLLIGSLMGNVMAQDIITNPLLFVFKLHGQTRKYQFTFNQSNDTLYLHWGIERNTRWQSGSYAMPQEALKTAVRLSFLQPEDGQHICLPIQETFALLSATAFQELKSQKAFHYNQTEYQLADTKSQAMGYSLLHVNDSVDGCEMWIMDNPDFPLIWEIQNNPLGINWKVAPIDLPAHNLKEEIIQSPEKMGSIYYAYPTPNGIQTPVPEGYSPFYISHYGRHGSRWMTSDERYLEVIRVFDTFHNKSGLTDLGEDVRLRLQKVWENARGRGGNLTPLGERQHKAIAKRLYQQYPHIFRDSANISARSSVSVRCIMSMSAFTEQLKELNPLPPDHPRSQPKTHGLHCLYFTRSRKAGFGKCAMENSFPYIRRKSYSSGTFNRFTFQKSQRSQESPRAHDGTLLDCFRHARCRVASILL
ncbi:histidine-type phosphatase [Phocaeicola vulgatus]|nr:histidine-type phosphatase [Phocaeicola vulgatus]